jgi:hypothetical protein
VRFRDRLFATLRAAAPVLETGGTMVVGSEVPNLLEAEAGATLVVSQDVDIAVPVGAHALVKERLSALQGLRPSPEEPSVWVPAEPALLEVNFVGMPPPGSDLERTYLVEDGALPLLVFGPLALLRPGPLVRAEGVDVPVPRLAGLVLEKLLTDRTGEKGSRDLLVVLALLMVARETDLEEATESYVTLPDELRHAARANLTILSLIEPHDGMPDPRPQRARVAALLRRFEGAEESA